MMKYTKRIIHPIGLLTLVFWGLSAQAQYKKDGGVRILEGTIAELKIHDLRNDKSLSPSEQKYSLNVVIDQAPAMILGFDLDEPNAKVRTIYQAWLGLLQDAFIHQNKVKIRWQSRAKIVSGEYPPHADILSVYLSQKSE